MAGSYFLNRVMQPVSPTAGESGYFSAPTDSLDPHLFEGGSDVFRNEVRTWILNTLYSFWETKYKDPGDWSTVWIAGSGISHQWAASRGNGDLDILIGVDFPAFFRVNDRYLGLSEQDVAEIFNQEFHADLWPNTADTEFSSTIPGDLKKAYEVTFYVNPNATDIRSIHPYAAFNLTDNEWTVRPPTDFSHPEEFYKTAGEEERTARRIANQYNAAAAQAGCLNPGSPGWLNAVHAADLAASQAATLYDSIHLGRKMAFAESGSGYGDYYNFRWQYHKQHGTAQLLHAVASSRDEAQQDSLKTLYGGPVDGAEVSLRRAALWNRGGNGRN